MSTWREGEDSEIVLLVSFFFLFFCDSRENLVVGQLGFEKSEVQQVTWNHCCVFLS